MGFGRFTPEMDAVVLPLIKDKHVYDLGAGDCGHARWLARSGARLVTAVDKEKMPSRRNRKIHLVQDLFIDLEIPDRIDVAFLAWPQNMRLLGLIDILRVADRIIYLGSNMYGTACGWPALFDYFTTREELEYIEHSQNSLIVLGQPLETWRSPNAEEQAALDMWRTPRFRGHS